MLLSMILQLSNVVLFMDNLDLFPEWSMLPSTIDLVTEHSAWTAAEQLYPVLKRPKNYLTPERTKRVRGRAYDV